MERSAILDSKPKSMWWSLFVGAAIFLYDVFKTVSTVLGVAFLIRFFIIQPFYISGNSMEPSFHNNQYIIVDQLTPRFNDYHRGDVVVFKYPRNQAFQYIKRVVGLPGEKIEISDGRVLVFNSQSPQGIAVEEEYINGPTRPLGKTSFTIPQGSYFLMGDNRPNSSDSRDFGPVARGLIVGRVQLVLYPFDQFQSVHRPVYGRGL